MDINMRCWLFGTRRADIKRETWNAHIENLSPQLLKEVRSLFVGGNAIEFSKFESPQLVKSVPLGNRKGKDFAK
jgi:hypothetical protein